MGQTFLTLNNGLKIPQFGMGVYMVPEGEQTKQACLSALNMGYRHIDTAHAYQNERSVGAAVRESGIPREEIWVTSKLYFQQNELKKRVAKYGTVIESWYPIGHGDKGLINEPVFTRLAEKYGKSNVQVILRWHIQAGNVIFPKSANPQHIRDNFDIFDFELTAEEMAEIAKLD